MTENNLHILPPFKFDITLVQDNMSNNDYHAEKEYISSSFVKTTHKHSVGQAIAPPPLETPEAFLFGDAFHERMELGHLSDRFITKPEKNLIMPAAEVKSKYGYEVAKKDILDAEAAIPMVDDKSWDARTKMGKAWVALNGDKIILNHTQITSIDGMYESAMNIPFVKELMDSPSLTRHDEWSYFANGDDDNLHGLKFRVRPDVHFTNNEGGIEYILDWKSCNDLKKLIRWDFMGFGYDIQAVFYSDFLGVDPRRFLFICVEKTFPFSSRILRLSDETIDNARIKMRDSIQRIYNWKRDPTQYDIDLPPVITI